MKLKLIIAALALIALFQCRSSSEIRLERVNACAALCRSHPAVKAMTFDQGGGSLFLLGGGYSKETCACSRGGK